MSSPAWALDPSRAVTQYAVDRWSVLNGLPQDKVQAITQTPDGYLWVGTLHGLAKFDGVRFVPFVPKDAPELETESVHGLYTARDGSVWIGTDFKGLAHWKDGHIVWYRSTSPFATEIRTIREDRSGVVWVTAENGLFRVSGSTLRPVTLDLMRVFDLAPDPDGSVWVGAERGLFRFPGNVKERMDPWKGATGPAGWIFATLPEGGNAVWAGGGGGLVHWRSGLAKTYSEKDGLPNKWVRCLLKDSHGVLWVGTFGGLARFTGGRFEAFTVDDGLSDREVSTLFEDREGSLWIGTRGGGMTRLRDVPAVTFTLGTGNVLNPTAPFEDSKGNLWAGTDDGSLLVYRDGKWTRRRYEQLGDKQITHIAEDSGGDLVMVAGQRLFRLRADRVAPVSLPGSRKGRIHSLVRDRDGAIWAVGSENQLYRFKLGQWHAVTVKGQGIGEINDLVVARNGGFWALTDDGILKVEGSRATVYWLHPEALRGDLLNLIEDDDGSIWVGTEGNGILHLTNGRLRQFDQRDGLPDDSIMDMLADERGKLWIGSQSGIFSVRKVDLQSGGPIRAETFTTLDGLRSNSFEVGNARGACRTRNGVFWFASSHGLVMLDPRSIHPNKLVPSIIVERVEVNGHDLSPGANATPGRGEVLIQYASTSLLQPSRVRFQYRLEGFDKDWSPVTNERQVKFANLAPGSYRFLVRGSNNDGLWNPHASSFAFTIPPHFYQSWWFRLVCGCFLVGSISIGFWLRIGGLRASQRRLDQVVQAQTRLLQEANQKLVALTRTDALSGTANRRYFDEYHGAEFRRCIGQGVPLSLLMIDLDHFKLLNDTLGHQAGDACIADIGALMKGLLHAGELVARYGGEEFAVILPGTGETEAIARAEQIVNAVCRQGIVNPKAPRGVVTVSVGVATVNGGETALPETLLSRADEALYHAKRSGRNRVEAGINAGRVEDTARSQMQPDSVFSALASSFEGPANSIGRVLSVESDCTPRPLRLPAVPDQQLPTYTVPEFRGSRQ